MDEIFIISGFVAFGMLIWLLIRAEIQARKNLKNEKNSKRIRSWRKK